MSDQMYDPAKIEPAWQKSWEEQQLFQNSEQQPGVTKESKRYLLFAFAYPSGSGLHVGHVESKTALDIVARYDRMHGRKVFFPVGWDAFGLPAENYAIKTGVPPAQTTVDAIHTFRRQIKRLGISYDWANEVATNHPKYYRWTQWIFLQLYKKGLAYRKNGLVNWCSSCQTVLANEQVVDGACERCSTQVVQKNLEQWYFKITEYRDELISGLDQVDWPTPTKQQQINWIGRKEGISITYPVVREQGADVGSVTCFTTRPETNFGATFVVIAPEHELAAQIVAGELKMDQVIVESIRQYQDETSQKTELERQQEGRKKSGVFTGLYAVNQLTNRRMPIWISDFVLAGFGTGAVVGVPGHDLRDFQFAEFANAASQATAIPILRVIKGLDGDESEIVSETQVQEDEGVMVNSEFLNGKPVQEALEAMKDHLVAQGWGERVTTYKLRDWLISRQRYWGAPIPIVYDPEGNPHPVKDEHLPWLLPTDVEFKPTGESPLRHSEEFKERTERLYGKGWTPEYDTMDTFVDSSWYYLRYVSSRSEEAFSDPERLREWLPVDLYMIGPEHIVLHLLYSRFFTKFLRDEGYLKFDEPFMKMRHQGMILGPDGKKMSKSKGNVINPDDIIEKFGADTLRVYEMFMGPLEADKAWNTRAVIGVHKFLQRFYRFAGQAMDALNSQASLDTKNTQASARKTSLAVRKLHQTIAKVTQDIPQLKFNTAIAAFMECLNVLERVEDLSVFTVSDIQSLILILAPFAPFMTEELYQRYWPGTSVHLATWPVWDEDLATENQATIVVQINGKVRAELQLDSSVVGNQALVSSRARELEKLRIWIEGKKIFKEIYIPGKVLNLVVQS